jgi:photosystem II stability/assembly factor-like uncharacterized protein
MRYRLIILLVAGSLLGLSALGQNRATFFKTVPPVDETTPEWAILMYSENPNVAEVDFLYEEYFENHPFKKNIHTQNYKHWRRLVDQYMDVNGHIVVPSQEEQQVRLNRMERRYSLKSGRNGDWQCIGPFTTLVVNDVPDLDVSWQANVYCFDQSESRPDILFAGCEAGGLFKSYDKGLHWNLVSAAVPVATITDVKISPVNPDLVFFTSNQRIYRSTDGGENWEQVFVIGDDGWQLLFHPTDGKIMFCAANNGLLKSTDGGTTWNRLFTGTCWDIKFHPSNADIVYLIKTNTAAKRAEFFKSTDGGNTFSIRESGWYVPTSLTAAKDEGAKIGVTPAAPERVYVALIGQSKSGDNGWIGLYRSTNAGESWVNPNLPDGGPYNSSHPNPATFDPDGKEFHQGFYNFALAVSHTDPDKLWMGTVTFNRSTNGGASWTRIGSYYAQQDIGWIHPDIQDLHVRGNEIFVCSDGGINYSTDELRTHESRNYGLAGSDYWGFGQGWNEDVLVGGRYHNGNSGYYQTYGTGNSLRLGGAESATGYVNPIDNRKTYFSDISSALLPETYDGQVVYFSKLGKYPRETYAESYSSEIEWDPRYADHLYLGEGSKIWKSEDGGKYFEAIYNFGTGKVLEIEVSRSNPKVIYCVFQNKGGDWDPCGLRKSTDGGKTWSSLTLVPSNDRLRLEIALNPDDENDLWAISVNASDGRKIYRTLDGGKTWTSMNSDMFNGERPRDVVVQSGTGGVTYFATSAGMYVYDPTAAAWSEFMNGLPVDTRALEMKPFYAAGKLRLATAGRGIWETPLYGQSVPDAMPMTLTDTLYSPKDTVRFESYSVVMLEGAQWEWTISPQPQWISSATARNPKVVFGSKGTYDVTLRVADALGRSGARTLPAMITITDPGIPDPLAGKAMSCTQSGEYALTDDLGIKTNILTITAWVKPDGVQPDYSAIVMNNGTAAGFNFRGGNNTLGYHWPGGAWYWDSHLTVPAGQWSYVAMVANGNSMTVYVNGIGAKHTVNLQQVNITTMNIGNYMGWGDRNFKGQIDEVCIWKRALTQEEIRELQNLTKPAGSGDADLIGYYQFNESGGTVFNRASDAAGSLMGETKRIASTAPVGPGTSSRLTLNGSGTYSFEGTGMTLTLPGGGSVYPGETVVTRIGALPAMQPVNTPNLGCYWVMNNYGSDHFMAATDLLLVPVSGEASDTITRAPEHAGMYTRSARGSDSSWEKLCGALSVGAGDGGVFRYGSSCGVAGSVQIFIASDQNSVPLLKGTSTGINELNIDHSNAFSIYPNPAMAGGVFTLKSTEPMERVRILSLDGKLIRDLIPGKVPEATVETAGMDTGTYLIRVQTGKFISTSRLIIQ